MGSDAITRPMPMWTNPGISLQVSEPRPSGSSLCLNEHRGHVLHLNSAAAKDTQRILKKAAAHIAIADISRERHLQLLLARNATCGRKAGCRGFGPAARGRVSPTRELGAAAGEAAEAPPNPSGRPGDEGEVGTEEVEEHESTGPVRYRTWCRHCVARKGAGQQHWTRDEEARSRDGIPMILIFCNYTFMTVNGEDDGRAKPIFVIKDRRFTSGCYLCGRESSNTVCDEVLQQLLEDPQVQESAVAKR